MLFNKNSKYHVKSSDGKVLRCKHCNKFLANNAIINDKLRAANGFTYPDCPRCGKRLHVL